MDEKWKKIKETVEYVIVSILFVLFLIAMFTIVPIWILDWMW